MENTRCAKCGHMNEPEARFCSSCGSPVAASGAGEAKSRGHKSNWKRDGLIMSALVVFVAAAYFGLKKSPEPPRPEAGAVLPGHESMSAEVMGNLPTGYAELVEMGNQFMDQGNYPMAAELYRRALAIDGSSSDVRSDYASCLHAMGLPQRALEEFRRVIGVDLDHPIVHFNLGIVFQTLGQTDSARYYWEKYLQMDPQGQAAEAARQYLKEMGT